MKDGEGCWVGGGWGDEWGGDACVPRLAVSDLPKQ